MAYTGLDHYILAAITLGKSFLLTLKFTHLYLQGCRKHKLIGQANQTTPMATSMATPTTIVTSDATTCCSCLEKVKDWLGS